MKRPMRLLLVPICVVPLLSLFFCMPMHADGQPQEVLTRARSKPVVLRPASTSAFINLVEPAASVLRESEVTIRGTVVGCPDLTKVLINGTQAHLGVDGGFWARIALAEGENQIQFAAEGSEGLAAQRVVTLISDLHPPTIVMIDTAETEIRGVVSQQGASARVRGKATDPYGIRGVTINGTPVPVESDGGFVYPLPLKEGKNTIVVRAADLAGNTAERIVAIDHTTRRDRSDISGMGVSYALLIGIDGYRGAWKSLKNAVRDARAVEEVLRKEFRFTQIFTLYDEQATRADIVKTFETIDRLLQPNDNLFIYYSGHGYLDQKIDKGYWVPFDATEQSKGLYLSNQDIQSYMSGMGARHILLVADACFSSDILRGDMETTMRENTIDYYKTKAEHKSRQALTSGALGPVVDGGRDNHSAFNYYFLQALKTIPGPYFDGWHVYELLKGPVKDDVGQDPQYRAIKNTGDDGGEFIFMRK